MICCFGRSAPSWDVLGCPPHKALRLRKCIDKSTTNIWVTYAKRHVQYVIRGVLLFLELFSCDAGRAIFLRLRAFYFFTSSGSNQTHQSLAKQSLKTQSQKHWSLRTQVWGPHDFWLLVVMFPDTILTYFHEVYKKLCKNIKHKH